MKISSNLKTGAGVAAFAAMTGALTAAFTNHALPTYVPEIVQKFGIIGGSMGLLIGASAAQIRQGCLNTDEQFGKIISGGLGCALGTLSLMFASIINREELTGRFIDTVAQAADQSLGADWASGKKGTSLQVNTVLSPAVSIPTKITVQKKEQTIYADMYKGHAGPVYVRTCIDFNAKNAIPVERPFDKNLTACTQRNLTLEEIRRAQYILG